MKETSNGLPFRSLARSWKYCTRMARSDSGLSFLTRRVRPNKSLICTGAFTCSSMLEEWGWLSVEASLSYFAVFGGDFNARGVTVELFCGD